MITKYLINFIKFVVNNYSSNKKNKKLKYPFNKKLTKQELETLKLYWGEKIFSNSRIINYEFYKAFDIFDPALIPNDFYAEAEYILNPLRYSLFSQHKCLLKYFIPKENRPETILQNINGHYLDCNDNIIDRKEALAILKKHLPFMIKIAVNSGAGRGIEKIENASDVDNLFNTYNKDFICQKVLVEHSTLSRFNPGCVNTIRVLSLNINNKCDILSSFVRVGGLGSIVDNLHSSKGTGVLFGIKENGCIHTFGIDKDYNKLYDFPSGINCKNIIIEHYDKIVNFVKEKHQKDFPFANLIGWDIIIDKYENPIVIEINLDSADIAAHQIFNGPIFGKRTNEVLEYLKNNP